MTLPGENDLAQIHLMSKCLIFLKNSFILQL